VKTFENRCRKHHSARVWKVCICNFFQIYQKYQNF